MNKTTILKLLMGLILTVSAVEANDLQENQSVTIKQEDMVDSDLIVKDSRYKLVFFGYAGCYHFCDPRLRLIDPIYENIKQAIDVKMLFIDISETTTLKASEVFVKDVNPEFEAINPSNRDVLILQRKFQDVYVRKMPDGEYLHSGFLYLLKKEKGKYYLIKTYLEFTDTEAVAADIRKIAVE